ncbi:MAG: DUF3737 family protein [Alistipes onderdonkii]
MQIKNATYGGERPCSPPHGLRMEHVTIQAGESALASARYRSRRLPFRRQIPFWHVDGFVVRNCLFTEEAHARRCGIRATLR